MFRAAESQAIEVLLISDKLFRAQDVATRKKYVKLVDEVIFVTLYPAYAMSPKYVLKELPLQKITISSPSFFINSNMIFC